ncbi:GNAT family N-acetyltransferase [Flavobacterium sp. K77]|uniref:GNAT family N-acetyltransferase n=1 Tax=Flavobacterium sp. K77 TaxID=2910676 RepID=UPI001F441172|nr:GNAT family N-acetyltransferase [Flavobacterium sp. K77]MCF6140952.1 GNAT family N-acetyltransferase [Flavobacterium sp. K77]
MNSTNYQFKKATTADHTFIWEILADAIVRRKTDGSTQWQDGYPNPTVVENDIRQGNGFVLLENHTIVGYCALIINYEPAYEAIEGKWLSDQDFVVIHRVAIAQEQLGKGLAKKIMTEIENYAMQHHIFSIKADTNFDNLPMLHLFEKLGYSYCGEVYFRGSARKAFEKVLK